MYLLCPVAVLLFCFVLFVCLFGWFSVFFPVTFPVKYVKNSSKLRMSIFLFKQVHYFDVLGKINNDN